MVRTAGGGARPNWAGYPSDEDNFESEGDVSEEEYSPSKKAAKSPRGKAKVAKAKPTKATKAAKTPRGKISPSKTPASKRKFVEAEFDDDESEDEPASKKRKKKAAANLNSSRASGRAKGKVKYNYDDDNDEEEEDEEEEEDDYDEPVVQKNRKSPKAGKATARMTAKTPTKAALKATPKSTGRAAKAPARYNDYEEVIELGSSDDEEEEEEDEEQYKPKKKRGLKIKKVKAPAPRTKLVTSKAVVKRKPDLPPVSEMVIESIKALKDPPRKGSTLRAIKETIGLNWPVNMRIYDVKIKKFMKTAIEHGKIIQTRGSGFSGRFSVPGLKPKKKKARQSGLGKKFDEDEVEYQPKKTKRDEEREKDKEEIERRRTERQIYEERVKAERAAERANKPKKPVVKKDSWEVEAIKGVKEVDGAKFYLVKFVGYSKKYWEPEENVKGCTDLIALFEEEEQRREAELEEIRRKGEVEGVWEVQKILEVKTKKDGSKEFLIRWKGCGAKDDTWEPEANLDCPDLISSFLRRWESIQISDSKSLRVAPKKVKRLAFANDSSSRASKRNHGFRVTYEDMDE